jgi:hypothetical protein
MLAPPALTTTSSTEAARIEAEYVPRRYVGSVAGRPLPGRSPPRSSRVTLYDCSVTVLMWIRVSKKSARVGSLERHELTENGPQAAYLIETEPRAARQGCPVSVTTTLI